MDGSLDFNPAAHHGISFQPGRRADGDGDAVDQPTARIIDSLKSALNFGMAALIRIVLAAGAPIFDLPGQEGAVFPEDRLDLHRLS